MRRDKSVLIVNGKKMKYPKVYYQYKALRKAWQKSSSEMKDPMIEMLTESMNEVIEIYNLEQDALAELVDYEDIA